LKILGVSFEYGKNKNGTFDFVKQDKITSIDKLFRISYSSPDNFVKLTVTMDNAKFGTCILDLNDYKQERVFKHWIDIIDTKNTDNDLEFEIGILCEHSGRRQKSADSIFAHSLKRKLPERVDILNEETQREFIKKMGNNVLYQLEFEKEMLSEYYSSEEINLLLNEKYNFVLTKENLDFGRISLKDLKNFTAAVLDPNWEKYIDEVYHEFITSTKNFLDNKHSNVSNLLDKAAVMLLCTTLSRRNHQLYGMASQDVDYVFSLRNFIVTLILMSAITVNQKLSLLYEIIDWEDGERDGLDIKAVQLISNTVLYRNLQFVPTNQVNNMIEILFQKDASCITSWVYTTYSAGDNARAKFDMITKKARQSTLGYDDDIYEEQNSLGAIDLTHVFQDILWKYHDLFGCKSLWFHPKFSPFNDLQHVIRSSRYDVYLPKKKNTENVLCIVYMTDGIKRVYTAFYDSNHKLLRVDEEDGGNGAQFEGIEKILYDNKFFWNIENYPKSIWKEDFIYRWGKVPYFSDFMRTETILQINDMHDIVSDIHEPLDNNLIVYILDEKQAPMIACEFNLHCQMQDYQMNRNMLFVTLPPAYKPSTLLDVEERVKEAVNEGRGIINTANREIDRLEFSIYLWGFKKYGSVGDEQLSSSFELSEIVEKNGYELVFFPIKKCEEINRNPPPIAPIEDAKYDCYCLIDEIGSTKQWVPCYIIDKKNNQYIVEIKTKSGYEAVKSRQEVLLSKAQMNRFERELF
jgi:hypothetical protein